MTSRPFSSFIPTNWTQQQKRPDSVHSQSSQESNHSNSIIPQMSTSWSFDQLSFYARKASIPSINLLLNNNNEQEEKKKKKQADKLQSTINGFIHILLMSLNDYSIGYYRISDHIHRKVPRIVELKKLIREKSKKVDIAVSDIEDVRKNVADLERLESFYNMNQMIQKSLSILKESK